MAMRGANSMLASCEPWGVMSTSSERNAHSCSSNEDVIVSVKTVTGRRVSDAARARGICAQNSEQWTAALIDLIDDADRRQRMGQHGRQYIQQTHSLDHLSDQLAKLFNSLVT